MKQHILPAIKLTVICLLLFCGVYTLIILGLARFAPNKGRGETIDINGKTAGYLLEGQNFTQDKYFWGRPSAVSYNAAGSGASNKAPSNPDYIKDLQSRIDTFLLHNPGIKKAEIPSELVTASASGLDPHLSLQGVYIQIPRIARVRNLTEDRLKSLVDIHTEKPFLGLFGTVTVNILQLNIDLDKLN
jgi:potassium-transporting ATPase KdpC subunit